MKHQEEKITKYKYKDYNFVWRMNEIKYIYDEKFDGNTLIAGRTGCGNIKFIQDFVINKLFGVMREIYWIYKIELSKDKEDNIRHCFTDQIVKFHYPNN